MQLDRNERTFAICCLVVLLVAAVAPATGLPTGYHDFVDRRTWFGVPNGADVLSNIPFLAAGVAGLALLAVRPTIHEVDVRGLLALFFVGLAATTFTSGYYHLDPSDDRLVVDRLGMSMAFAGLLGLAAEQVVSERAGVAFALVLLPAGVVAIVIARHGNQTPWALLQGIGMVLILIAGARARGPLRATWFWVVVLYALSKLAELGDAQLFAWTSGVLSGHALKHVLAACAGVPILVWMERTAESAQQESRRAMHA